MKKFYNLLFIPAVCLLMTNCGGASSGGNAPEIQGPLVIYGSHVQKQSDVTTVISAIRKVETIKELDTRVAVVLLLEDGNYYEVSVNPHAIDADYHTLEDIFNDDLVLEAQLSDKYESFIFKEGVDKQSGTDKQRRFPMAYSLIDKKKLYEAERWLAKNKPETEPIIEWTTAKIVHTVPVYRPDVYAVITCLVYTDNGQRLYIKPYDITGYGTEPFDLAGMNIEYRLEFDRLGNPESVKVRNIE